MEAVVKLAQLGSLPSRVVDSLPPAFITALLKLVTESNKNTSGNSNSRNPNFNTLLQLSRFLNNSVKYAHVYSLLAHQVTCAGEEGVGGGGGGGGGNAASGLVKTGVQEPCWCDWGLSGFNLQLVTTDDEDEDGSENLSPDFILTQKPMPSQKDFSLNLNKAFDSTNEAAAVLTESVFFPYDKLTNVRLSASHIVGQLTLDLTFDPEWSPHVDEDCFSTFLDGFDTNKRLSLKFDGYNLHKMATRAPIVADHIKHAGIDLPTLPESQMDLSLRPLLPSSQGKGGGKGGGGAKKVSWGLLNLEISPYSTAAATITTANNSRKQYQQLQDKDANNGPVKTPTPTNNNKKKKASPGSGTGAPTAALAAAPPPPPPSSSSRQPLPLKRKLKGSPPGIMKKKVTKPAAAKGGRKTSPIPLTTTTTTVNNNNSNSPPRRQLPARKSRPAPGAMAVDREEPSTSSFGKLPSSQYVSSLLPDLADDFGMIEEDENEDNKYQPQQGVQKNNNKKKKNSGKMEKVGKEMMSMEAAAATTTTSAPTDDWLSKLAKAVPQPPPQQKKQQPKQQSVFAATDSGSDSGEEEDEYKYGAGLGFNKKKVNKKTANSTTTTTTATTQSNIAAFHRRGTTNKATSSPHHHQQQQQMYDDEFDFDSWSDEEKKKKQVKVKVKREPVEVSESEDDDEFLPSAQCPVESSYDDDDDEEEMEDVVIEATKKKKKKKNPVLSPIINTMKNKRGGGGGKMKSSSFKKNTNNGKGGRGGGKRAFLAEIEDKNESEIESDSDSGDNADNDDAYQQPRKMNLLSSLVTSNTRKNKNTKKAGTRVSFALSPVAATNKKKKKKKKKEMKKKNTSPLAALDESDDDDDDENEENSDDDGTGRSPGHDALKELQAAFQRVMSERRATAEKKKQTLIQGFSEDAQTLLTNAADAARTSWGQAIASSEKKLATCLQDNQQSADAMKEALDTFKGHVNELWSSHQAVHQKLLKTVNKVEVMLEEAEEVGEKILEDAGDRVEEMRMHVKKKMDKIVAKAGKMQLPEIAHLLEAGGK